MVQLNSCPAVESWLRYARNELTPAEADSFDEHIATCDQCLQTLKSFSEPNERTAQVPSSRGGGIVEPSDQCAELLGRLKDLYPNDTWALAGLQTTLQDPSESRHPHEPSSESATSGIYDKVPVADLVQDACEELGLGPSRQLGPYRIVELLGRGGMGIVFRADDTQLGRTVALKVMAPRLAAHPAARERFLREARMAASIRHDHVVVVHQVGEEGGVPYLAMELLKGESLDDRLKRHGKIEWREALRIGREITEGLAEAHARKLVHRDIKPANIWLEPQLKGSRIGTSPDVALNVRVKLLDFGLARAVEKDRRLTEFGAIIGTPTYMAPEQARGELADARSDLFSLGCVLYRMTTGEEPFKGRDLISVLNSLATTTPKTAQQLNPEIPASLSQLIERLMAKDPSKRPESAEAVVAEMERLEARQSSPAFKSTQSNAGFRRALYAVSAALAAACLLIGVLFGGQVIRFATNKGELVIRVHDENVVVTVKENGVVVADKTTQREFVLTAGEGEIEVFENDGNLLLATKKFTLRRGDTEYVTVEYAELAARRQAVGEEAKKSPTFAVRRAPSNGSTAISPTALVAQPATIPGVNSWTLETVGHRGAVNDLVFSPDGNWLATAGEDGTLRVWNATTWDQHRVFVLRHRAAVAFLAWSPDGMHLAYAAELLSRSGPRSELSIWEVDTGKSRLVADCAGHCLSVSWSPDGSQLAVAGESLRIFDTTRGELVYTLNEVVRALYSPDGSTLVVQRVDASLRFLDANTKTLRGEFKLPFPEKYFVARPIAWSPDGKTLAVGPAEFEATAWFIDPVTAEVLVHNESVPLFGSGDRLGLAWSPDSNRLAVAASVNSFAILDTTTGMVRAELPCAFYSSVAWSPNGENIVGLSDLGAMTIFDAATGEQKRVLPCHQEFGVARFVWSPDGSHITTDYYHRFGGFGHSIELQSGGIHEVPSVNSQQPTSRSPDGRMIAASSGIPAILQADSQSVVHQLDHVDISCGVFAWSADSTKLVSAAASGGNSREIKLWDAGSGKLLQVFSDPFCHEGYRDLISGMAISPNDKYLAVACANRLQPMVVLDMTSGQLQREIDSNGLAVTMIAYSTDGTRLAVGGRDGQVKVFGAADGKLLSTIAVHDAIISALAWSADDRLLVSGGNDAIRLWQVETGEVVATYLPLDRDEALAISPDGHYRATNVARNELVYVIATDSGQELLTPVEFAERFQWRNEPPSF